MRNKKETLITKTQTFSGLIVVKDANPNGDPLSENMPRTEDGFGFMTHECMNRKIRNVWIDDNRKVFMQSRDRNNDGHKSLQDRFNDVVSDIPSDKKNKKEDEKKQRLIDTFLDVRAFGAVIALEKGLSIHVTGAISLPDAYSVNKVEVVSTQITKSMNGKRKEENEEDKRTSDTMGMRHKIKFGLYRFNGTVNVLQSKHNELTEEDLALIKDAIMKMFDNDASCARPAGSMYISNFIWITPKEKNVPLSVCHNILKTKQINFPAKSLDDFEITVDKHEDLNIEVLV